jgi:hypothetical protein
VTPNPGKRSSESDFDSGGLSILASRNAAAAVVRTKPVREVRSREDRSMLQHLALAAIVLFAVVALASIAAAALSVVIFPG